MRAAAQNDSKPAEVACPAAAEVQPRHLHGLWRAEFEGAPGATLLIEPHREFAMSISGTVNRNGARAQLAGDLEEGEFTLEESADGARIAATWLGDVVEGSCGREIRGTWQAELASRPEAAAPSAIRFVLRKQAER
jgi:hypothetical protein